MVTLRTGLFRAVLMGWAGVIWAGVCWTSVAWTSVAWADSTNTSVDLRASGGAQQTDLAATLPGWRLPYDPDILLPEENSALEPEIANLIGASLEAPAHNDDRLLQDLPYLPVVPDSDAATAKLPPPPVAGRIAGITWSGIVCQPELFQHSRATEYWNRVSNSTSTSVGKAEAPEPALQLNSAGEWCTARTHLDWATEPFTIAFWGPFLIVTLGFVLFWTARGYRRP